MRSSKLFIIIFLISLILVGPFIIKHIMHNSISKSNAEVQSTETLATENEQNINVLEKEHNQIENPKKQETIDENNQISQDLIDSNNIETPKIQEQIKNEETNIYEKQTVEKTYFDDALFIGDSRTVGISEYGGLENATFFANTGMSVYNIFDKTVSVPKVGKVKIEQLITDKIFGKVYIMLGINELGYNQNNTLKKYKELVEYIQKKQPNAIIYIEANLHVTAEKSNKDTIFNNTNINRFNNEISKLADNKTIFYIDINEKFCDKNGNLLASYSQDNVHIYAKYYKEWSNWLSQKTVKKGGK